MKRCMAIVLGAFSMFAYADNLREIVVAAGGEPMQGYNNLLSSPDQETIAKRAFDGICTNAIGDNARCLGGNGMYVTFGIPAALVPDGKKVAVTRYRVYQLNGGSNANSRAPRAWTLSGSNDNSVFATIDSRAGVEWYSDSHEIGDNDPLPQGVDNWHEYSLSPADVTDWRYFRFSPTASKFSGGWNYVFSEIEFYGTIYDSSAGYCEIQNPASVVGEVYPDYGAVTSTGATFRVASRDVEYKGAPYSLAGWKLEKWVDSEWVETATGEDATYTYVPDGGIYRFSWVWAIGQCQLTVSVAKDVGFEYVSCSPASPTGLYDGGTVVTLTAHPATTPHASTFVCWRGDIPDGVDATSSELQVTMDSARSIEAVFDRSGWPWAFVTDGVSAHSGFVTDGNWKFKVAETTEDGFAGGKLSEFVFGDGLLDLTDVKAQSGLTVLSIETNLFCNVGTISGVKFNNELRRTGGYSFAYSSVGSVQFGTDLTHFDQRTFCGSAIGGIVDMSMCTNVTSFESEVYYRCSELEGIVLPPRLSRFRWRSVAECPKLASITCALPPEQYEKEMKNTSLQIEDDAIGGCNALELLELPCGGVVPFANMRGLTKLKKLVINGSAPASVGDIFTQYASYAPQPAYQTRIVVSAHRDREGWEALKTRAPTAEEKHRSDYPGSNTFGVLDAPGESRAWLVWGRSMFDPKSLVIYFR